MNIEDKKIEINNNSLREFDKIMETNLGEIETLVVSEIDKDYKVLNLISLCLNIKTLIIDSNQTIDTSKVLMRVCKPEMLKSLILRNVKLPSEKAMGKFNNLKMISLSDIRFNSIKNFFESISHPEKIEGISLINVDFEGESINLIGIFNNIKLINLKGLTNVNTERIDFIYNCEFIKKIVMKNFDVNLTCINDLISIKAEKDVSLEIKQIEKSKYKSFIIVNEEEKVLKTDISMIEMISNFVKIHKLSKLTIIFDRENNIEDYTKKLKKIKNKITVEVKDFSCLSSEQAKLLAERLKIEEIEILDTKKYARNRLKNLTYSIEDYILVRDHLDEICAKSSKYNTSIEKFLSVYKYIAETIVKDYDYIRSTTDISDLKNLLIEKKCDKNGYAEVLQNVLSILNIGSIPVEGNVNSEEKIWNKIKIDDDWYNVDLEMDSDTLSKKGLFSDRVNFCLLSDQEFMKTHQFIGKISHPANKSCDIKIIRSLLKSKIYSE